MIAGFYGYDECENYEFWIKYAEQIIRFTFFGLESIIFSQNLLHLLIFLQFQQQRFHEKTEEDGSRNGKVT
jgi:hypothetical protein